MIQKRKSKIVDRNLQYQIIGIVSTSGAAICLISVLFLKFLSNHLFDTLEAANINQEITLAITENIEQMTVYFIILVFLSLGIAWGVALHLSNRIAGPIYNINQVLDGYLEGNRDLRIKTRKNDFYSKLVVKINKLLEEKNEKD